MNETPHAAIAAIRAHPLVGRGSCSTVDECLDDAELLTLLSDAGALTTVAAAVEAALDFEGLKLEQATNCREGLDTDHELVALREFKAARDTN